MPGFFRGAARALDLGGIFDVYNVSNSESEADTMALASDWHQVGADLRDAMERYGHGG
jgi:hypothetical protein